MKAKPRHVPPQIVESLLQATRPLMPISHWRSDAIGVIAYVYEESEAVIRQSGLVPVWVGYPNERPGAGIAVPAHHLFPNYMKLLRLQSGRLRLVIDARAVLQEDTSFQRFVGNLLADAQLSLVKNEPI